RVPSPDQIEGWRPCRTARVRPLLLFQREPDAGDRLLPHEALDFGVGLQTREPVELPGSSEIVGEPRHTHSPHRQRACATNNYGLVEVPLPTRSNEAAGCLHATARGLHAWSMIPKSLPSDLIREWIPVFRLREAFEPPVHLALCFGGRRQVGKDHAQT